MLVQCWFTVYDAGPRMGQCIVFAGLNEPSTPVCFTHEGGERPMSLKLQSTKPQGSRFTYTAL